MEAFMNDVTRQKYILAFVCLIVVFIVLTAVLLFSNIGGEMKAAIVTFFITVPGTLIIQYYFRKAGSNEAEPDIPTNGNGTSPKADSPLSDMGGVQWTPNNTCSTCGTTSTTAANAPDKPVEAPVPTDEGDEFMDNYNAVLKDLREDKITLSDLAIASRMYSYYANHEQEMSDACKKEWIRVGLALATAGFEELSKLVPPISYSEVADFNRWWRSNKKNCTVKDWSIVRPPFMNLRSWLKLKESL